MSIAYEARQSRSSSAATTRQHHRFSLEEYEQMIEFGILTEDDRVELIRGEIVDKMTISEAHAACVKRLNNDFCRIIGSQAIVSVQDPVVILRSRPEPDVVLLVPREDFYGDSHPQVSDILLLIEVADSSLNHDRTDKLALYAEAGVREYWIANLIDTCVEVHRQPRPDGTYAEQRVLRPGEMLEIAALPSVSVAVDQVFGVRRDR